MLKTQIKLRLVPDRFYLRWECCVFSLEFQDCFFEYLQKQQLLTSSCSYDQGQFILLFFNVTDTYIAIDASVAINDTYIFSNVQALFDDLDCDMVFS